MNEKTSQKWRKLTNKIIFTGLVCSCALLDRTIYAECKIYGQHYIYFVEYWIKFIDVFLQSPTRILILIVQSLAYCFSDQFLIEAPPQ